MISTRIKNDADAAFKQVVQIRAGTKVMSEYHAARLAEDEKTARLRSARLARSAEETPAPEKHKAPRG